MEMCCSTATCVPRGETDELTDALQPDRSHFSLDHGGSGRRHGWRRFDDDLSRRGAQHLGRHHECALQQPQAPRVLAALVCPGAALISADVRGAAARADARSLAAYRLIRRSLASLRAPHRDAGPGLDWRFALSGAGYFRAVLVAGPD